MYAKYSPRPIHGCARPICSRSTSQVSQDEYQAENKQEFPASDVTRDPGATADLHASAHIGAVFVMTVGSSLKITGRKESCVGLPSAERAGSLSAAMRTARAPATSSRSSPRR